MATEHADNPGDPQPEAPRPASGLHLRPLPRCSDPAFPVLHDYFEVVYGSLIGPASVLLARSFARRVAEAGGEVTVCPLELSLELGLRASHHEAIGKGSHLAKAIERLAYHRLARRIADDTLAVAVRVPPLEGARVACLPVATQRVHHALVAVVLPVGQK